MHWFRFVILLLVAAMLQAGFVGTFAVGQGVVPDLFLILVVFFAVYCEPYDAVIISFAVGFAADIAGSTIGPHMISFGVVGTVLSDLNRFMALRKMSYQAVAIFLTGTLAGIVTHLLAGIQGQQGLGGPQTSVLWGPIYSAIIGPFLFLPAAWWMRIRVFRPARY